MSLAHSALRRLPPEAAHREALRLARVAAQIPGVLGLLERRYALRDPRLATRAFGLAFATPLGLAAGYDKDAVATDAIFALGFGHVEVGTVTRRPQPGNEGERLFRVPEARALINRLGFPNEGVDAMARRLSARSHPGILGVNVGKNKDVPLEEAPAEYAALYRRVAPFCDYVTVNVSSPNTEGLRSLQNARMLEGLLSAVVAARAAVPEKRPILVKIAPDLDEAELDAVAEAALSSGVDGVVATNTTLSREGLPAYAKGYTGGLSGAPLERRSLEVLRGLSRRIQGKIALVGVGGISTADHVVARLRAGASLVQLYTALIYEGPALARHIHEGLLEACRVHGVTRVADLVGVG